jgi:hypothetical protein
MLADILYARTDGVTIFEASLEQAVTEQIATASIEIRKKNG